MVFDLTIGGVAKLLKAGSLNIRQIANSRHTASFQLDSVDRSYRPAMDAEVIMEEDGVRVFGGLIDRPTEAALAGPLRPGIRTTINVVDFGAYTERRFVNETFPEQSLKDRLTTIIANYLDDFGITLHASQVTGPTLATRKYEYVRVDAVLNETMKLTADAGQPFLWSVSYAKVLRAFQPSTVAAPFDLIGNDLPEVIGDVQVEPSNEGKANRVVIQLVPKEEKGRVESFVGDGVTTTYDLQYTLTRFTVGAIHRFEPDGVTPSGGETIAITGTDTPTQWEISVDGTQITRVAGPTENLYVYRLTFDGVFSGTFVAEDPSWTSTPTSRREKVLKRESVIDDATAQALADSELAKSLTGPTTVRYKTWEQGIEPGQSQLVNVSSRNVNETGVITEVVIRDRVHRLERSVTVIVDDAQTNLDRGWGDLYKLWLGDKAGTGAAPTVTSVSTGGTPGPPFTSVQFNREGDFGGKETFKFLEAGNSVVIGVDSSITASAYESCFIAGADCHITDP
jgi:hypothetical protein